MTPMEEAAASPRAGWGMLVRVRVSLRAPGDPALAVASRYNADGSQDNREQSFPVLGVCGAWDSWSLRFWQVPSPCRPVRKEPQNGFLGANNVSVDKSG